jgi:hypothetical protein
LRWNIVGAHKRENRRLTQPFVLKGCRPDLPAIEYQVVTDEELIQGLSFPVFRRVSTDLCAGTISFRFLGW